MISQCKSSERESALSIAKKRAETVYRKRRHSFGTNDGKQYKKRRKNDGIVLPTKFLLGGNINDPLNLSSLTEDANQVTPQSSPLPTPKHRTHVEVFIPANLDDPLNLNCGGDVEESSLISPKGKGKRKRKRKRTESETTVTDDTECININVKLSPDRVKLKAPNVSNTTVDKIVSPVIPQVSGCNRYKKISENLKTKSDDSQQKNFKSKGKRDKNRDEPKDPKFRPKDARFQYGNYNRYYGYRNANQKSDPRLDNFKIEWFEGKDVLDIGCNVGHVTLAIARDFRPNKIIGLDIDESLIRIARRNVRHYIRIDLTQKEEFPISLPLFHGPIVPSSLSSSASHNDHSIAQFPNNIFFVKGNYVLESDDVIEFQQQEFDSILCLSLTKWIHLNWGDVGLKRVFKRIYAQLKPGGRLILEAQPWCSYKQKKKMTETTFKNFSLIKFKPEQFNEYLLSREIGFSTCELIGTPAHPSKGFCRPIHIFTKSNAPQQKEKNINDATNT